MSWLTENAFKIFEAEEQITDDAMSVIEPIASDDIKVRLRAALENTARAMKAKETDDIKSVELLIQRKEGIPQAWQHEFRNFFSSGLLRFHT